MRKKSQEDKPQPHWYHRLFRYPELWILGILALFTRLWQLGTPPAIVFDEVYFRVFASNYLDGHYFFDIHPPLIKLLFAGVGSLFHLSSADVASGDAGAFILRLLPALAGAALIPLIYVIVRQLGLGRRIATFGAALLLLDNALLVESRFVLMDSLLLLAGFGAISAYLVVRRSHHLRRWLWVLITGILLGILVTTKWSGLAIAGLLAATWFIESVRHRAKLSQMLGEAVTVITVVSVIYIGSFAVSFNLLNRSGEGDAFMSQKFQSTLIGSSYYDSSVKMDFWEKFVELNGEMYTAQSSLSDTTHPYASRWYSWPFMADPVYYWQGEMMITNDERSTQGHIYLLGNPVVWLLGAVSILVAVIALIMNAKWLRQRRNLLSFLLIAYALNFVPFAFIDRPMFLYHYLFAFIISLLITCVLIARLFDLQVTKYGRHAMTQTYWALIIIIVISFLYFLPLSYGWPLSADDLQQRMWLPSWR